MPTVDWSESEQRNLAVDGIYTFEIEAAELKISKTSGMEYISLRLRCVDDGSLGVFDNLSFSPQAKNILQGKLSALDMKGIPAIEPDMFPGRRIKAAIKRERGSDNMERMVVDISAKGSHAGYFKISAETQGDLGPATPDKKPYFVKDDFQDDIPFLLNMCGLNGTEGQPKSLWRGKYGKELQILRANKIDC